MFNMPLSDLAASLRLQDQARTTRAMLDTAAQEFTTGQRADVRAATGGDLAPVFALDRSLSRLDLIQQDLSLASGRAQTAQSALGALNAHVGSLGLDLLGALERQDPLSRDTQIAEAPGLMERLVATLNTEFAGRSLFSGASEDAAAIAPAETILQEVRALVSAATDAASAISAIDTYFDTPGGGFETTIYTGSTLNAAGVDLGNGSRIDYLPRADASAFRSMLKSVAMIAVAEESDFAADANEHMTFLTISAQNLHSATGEVTSLRAELGIAEEGLTRASDAAEAERTAVSISRNNILGVDPYEAASRLRELETQMESLYVLTARLSNLSLTNYIR